MKFDVMVVGAGPAGLTAAKVISRSGFSVAVLEKERRLGVKPCGEAVSKVTIEDAELEPSMDFIVQEIRCANIHAPNGRRITVKEDAGEGYIVNKQAFLQCLAGEAAEAGAHIYVNQPVVDLKQREGSVKAETKGGELEASLIIGADGFSSIVSHRLLHEKLGDRELISCVQYLIVNCRLDDPQTVEFFIGRDTAPYGYAWIFPKGGGKANVGLGVRGVPAKPYLDKFLKEHSRIFSRAVVVGVEAAPVTISGVLKRIVDDGVMLVGEAAGQVIPLTGGGIHSSIVGGKIAGETVVRALEAEDPSRRRLKDYVDRFNGGWGKRIRDSLKALRVLERLSDDDLNKLAELLDPQDILDLANGSDVARVAAKFLRHPLFSVKIARALLAG